MGLPLPPGVLYRLPHSLWPDSNDWSKLSDVERMDRQWRAYQGLFDPPLRRLDPSEPDHNVIDNRCEPIVSTGIDFLYGDEMEFEVTNDDGSQDEKAQKHLDAVWDVNVKMPTLSEYEINSSVFGHGFFKLDPDDEDTAPYPAISILPPRQMQIICSPRDVRKVRSYLFTYEDVNDQDLPVMRRERWDKQDNGGWVIREQEQQQGAPSMAAVLTPLTPLAIAELETGWYDFEEPASWNYPWAPIHDKKNLPNPNAVWGRSDLPMDLIHLNTVLNFLLSNENRVLYFQGNPKDIFVGVRAREIDVSPSGAICLPNPNAKVQHIELGGDLVAIRNMIEDVRESMDELSHVPSVAVGRLKNLPGVPSGVALKVAERPLMAKTLQKRALREALLVPLCQHILELGGFGVARKITCHWPEMLPSDDLQEAQTMAIWVQQMGVSQDTAQQRGGFDPEVEREKKDEEAKRALKAAQENAAAMGIQPGQPEQQNGGSGNQPEGQPQQDAGSAASPPAQAKKRPPARPVKKRAA